MGATASVNSQDPAADLAVFRRLRAVYEAKVAAMDTPTAEQQAEIWNALKAEYEAAMAGDDGLAAAGASNDARVAALFAKIDANSNGSISVDELRKVFGEAEAPALLAELDTIDVDGAVQLSEWQQFFANVAAAEGDDTMVSALTALESLVVSKEGEGEVDLEVAGAAVEAPEGAVAEKPEAGTPADEVLAQDSVDPPPAAGDASGDASGEASGDAAGEASGDAAGASGASEEAAGASAASEEAAPAEAAASEEAPAEASAASEEAPAEAAASEEAPAEAAASEA